MNTFTVLLEHDDDAVLLERLLTENDIGYECDVIGTDYLLYEFMINIENRKIVSLLLGYNNIKVVDFKSN